LQYIRPEGALPTWPIEQCCLLTPIPKFQREVSAHPKILLNNIRLVISVNTTVPECGSVIARTIAGILAVYTEHATSYDGLPPHRDALLAMSIAPSPASDLAQGGMPSSRFLELAQGRKLAASGSDTPLPYIIRNIVADRYMTAEEHLQSIERLRSLLRR
jgi:hypothetical protein